MANAITVVSSLTEEVADLLRHDNFDTRIYTWLSLAYNDVLQRMPTTIALDTEVVSLASAEYVDLTIGPQRIGNIVLLTLTDSSSNVYIPRYITPIDYERTAHSVQGGSLHTSTVPLAYTIQSSPEDTIGKARLYVYPLVSGTFQGTLFYSTNPLTDIAASTAYLSKIPYHFEHVVIWGATCYGARALRPELYQVYKAEYEQSLQDMTFILNYRPDSIPVLRSVGGPYSRSVRALAPPRFPDTIS